MSVEFATHRLREVGSGSIFVVTLPRRIDGSASASAAA
jgi:hypothetical protein